MRREENVSAGKNFERNVDHSRPEDLNMWFLDQQHHIIWDLTRSTNSKVLWETY